MNHYKYLEYVLPSVFKQLKMTYPVGLIVAHGDKGYEYRECWEKNGIPFECGMVIYLLSYCHPYLKEVRETDNCGWVAPEQWVIDNWGRFNPMIGEAERCIPSHFKRSESVTG